MPRHDKNLYVLPGRLLLDSAEPKTIHRELIFQEVFPIVEQIKDSDKSYGVFDLFCETPYGWGIGFERKGSWNDLVKSIMDGRFSKQGMKMKASGHVAVFVVVGDRIDMESGINPNSIMGALSSMVAKYNISVVPVGNDKEYVEFCLSYIRKFWAEHHKVREISTVIPTIEKREVRFVPDWYAMLAGIKGVDRAMIEIIAREFPNFASLVNAARDVNILVEIPGIGPAYARKFQKAFYETMTVDW